MSMEEARRMSAQLTACLPAEVSVGGIGVREKAPYKALAAREGLIHRVEELGRVACDSLDQSDFAVAAILTRATLEGAAVCWRLLDIVEGRSTRTPDALDNDLMTVLMGSRDMEEMPRAVNIITLISHLDRRATGVLKAYESLSEMAHPNWAGTGGMFSSIIAEDLTTRFGEKSGPYLEMISPALAASLGLFIEAYNRLGDEVDRWRAELTPI